MAQSMQYRVFMNTDDIKVAQDIVLSHLRQTAMTDRELLAAVHANLPTSHSLGVRDFRTMVTAPMELIGTLRRQEDVLTLDEQPAAEWLPFWVRIELREAVSKLPYDLQKRLKRVCTFRVRSLFISIPYTSWRLIDDLVKGSYVRSGNTLHTVTMVVEGIQFSGAQAWVVVHDVQNDVQNPFKVMLDKLGNAVSDARSRTQWNQAVMVTELEEEQESERVRQVKALESRKAQVTAVVRRLAHVMNSTQEVHDRFVTLLSQGSYQLVGELADVVDQVLDHTPEDELGSV